MNNDIVNSLVESYKEQGLSTHELLKDPVFTSLPIEKQIEAVQAYAGVLQVGGKNPSPGKLLAKSIVKGIMTGAATMALPLMALPKLDPAKRLGTIIAGGIFGGGLGAISGGVDYSHKKQEFDSTNKYLIHLQNNPNLDTAVRAISDKRRRELSNAPKSIMGILTKVGPLAKPIAER